MAALSKLSKLKDRVLEQVALAFVNRKWLARYGRATRLRLDSSARKIYIEVELKGESAPVEIEYWRFGDWNNTPLPVWERVWCPVLRRLTYPVKPCCR